MGTGSPLGDYLRARRAATRPEDVGLVPMGLRRVEGLRRDEVAQLAGISKEYYIRLEQGRDRQPSHQVLASLARGLHLRADGLEYMHRLVRIQCGGRRMRDPVDMTAAVDAGLRSLMAQWPSTPAYIVDRNLTIVMSNDAARDELPGEWQPGANAALIVFGEAWRRADPAWLESAERTAAALRFSSDPLDPDLHDLVGILSIRNPTFRALWARHDAAPVMVRDLTLVTSAGATRGYTQQTLGVPDERGLSLVVLHRADQETRLRA